MTGDLTNDVVAVVQKAAEALNEARRRIESLDRENRKLRKQLNIQTKRETVLAELREVDAEHRAEISGVVRPHNLAKILAKRRVLEQKLADLDGRGNK